jgi:hypothetical protein
MSDVFSMHPHSYVWHGSLQLCLVLDHSTDARGIAMSSITFPTGDWTTSRNYSPPPLSSRLQIFMMGGWVSRSLEYR